MNYEKEIEELLKPLPHKLQVRFALDCALDVKHLMTPGAMQALDATGKWLKGEATNAEVEAAAGSIAHQAHASYNAAYASYAAAAAASPRAAVYNASYASYAASYSAAYAAYAAAYAASATGNNKDKKIKEYYENLKTIISNMSELEKLVYNV